MSELRKVVLQKHIDIDEHSFLSGEHIVAADVARQLVNAGASYVDDDDYNSAIKATPKVEPEKVSPSATKPPRKSRKKPDRVLEVETNAPLQGVSTSAQLTASEEEAS